MGLIDADALKNEYCRQNECLQNHSGDCPNCFAVGVIDDAPTIDPASLRPKGEWITFGKRGIYGNMYACSECQAKYDGQSNFCPNCGADMRGDANE